MERCEISGLSFGDALSQTTPQRIIYLGSFTGASDLGTEQGMEKEGKLMVILMGVIGMNG